MNEYPTDVEPNYSRSYVEVDLDAIRFNLKGEREIIGPNRKLMVILKANAYGHGAVPCMRAIEDLADAYGVAIPEEALEIRRAGTKKMILILGHSDVGYLKTLMEADISLTVYDYENAVILSKIATENGLKAKIHIAVDTGMSRIGFLPTDDNVDVVRSLADLDGLELEGIFTHFAMADGVTAKGAELPFQRYSLFVEKLEQKGVTFPLHHTANSASILQFKESHLDMVRSGITTYGLYPSEEVPKSLLELKPAMQWKSEIIMLKDILPHTPVGYGETFVANRVTKVATIPIGYADGVRRSMSNRGFVLIRGRRAPIIGRVCMDQFMVDVTDIPGVTLKDTVTLLGRDQEEEIRAEEMAVWSDSFHYELVTSIRSRVPRKYRRKRRDDT